MSFFEANVRANTTQFVKDIKTVAEKTTVTVKVKADGSTDGMTTSMKKTIDSAGNLNTALKKVDSAGNLMSSSISTSSKHVATLGSKFLDVSKKVIAFGAVTSIIGGFTSAMYEAVESVKTMDASLTELKKVSDLSGEGLKSYTEDAFAMAKELSTTASNVTDAVAQFVQAGYDLGESEGLSKYAIMMQSIADETMTVDDSTAFLTSTIKAFNMTASDAEHVINSVNKVSNEYAITSNDLTDNLGKISSVANVAGVSFEELTGLMVSSVEKTRNASKSANAFKSIFINLQQMDASGTMPKLSEQFKEFGISMTDSSGATKNAFDLLNELSVAYQNVSKSTDVNKQNQMRTLLEDIGG